MPRKVPRAEPRTSSAYDRSATVYDQVYSWKDYAAEARRIREIVRRWGPSAPQNLLDVACGTGEHLRYFSRWCPATGVDRNAAMLAVARRKLPNVTFVRGSMQTFRRRERYDVITCLFSAIGYARSYADLLRTLRNFAHHLRPGGIVIVEPWLAPAEYRAGRGYLHTCGSEQRPIARMHWSERRGGRSIMDMHYLVAERRRVHHWVERHDMRLFDRAAMARAFRAAGLSVRRIPSRFSTQRGLYVGTRPEIPASPESRAGPRGPS